MWLEAVFKSPTATQTIKAATLSVSPAAGSGVFELRASHIASGSPINRSKQHAMDHCTRFAVDKLAALITSI
jgi:hypothetical protein